MRSVWHLLFSLALHTGRFRRVVHGLVAECEVLGEAIGRALSEGFQHLAVDLAHWLPNMPRGHESI
jgi:hypothetical protein